MPHFMIDCIGTIYQFVKPFLHKKMSIFEEYGAFNPAVLFMELKGNGYGRLPPFLQRR